MSPIEAGENISGQCAIRQVFSTTPLSFMIDSALSGFDVA